MKLLKRHTLDESTKSKLIRVSNLAVDAAREIIVPFFRSNKFELESKDSKKFDPVTKADKEAEIAMRNVIRKFRPKDGIIGEEFGFLEGETGFNWCLDPIDGTRSFISGTPTWGVLVALADDDGPFLGIIDQPYIGERFIGGLGIAKVDGPLGIKNLMTRKVRRLEDAILFSTFPEIGTKKEFTGFREVADRVRLVRYGADCYAYALLALGQIDLVIEAGLKSYDIQAPISVVEAAGGFVANWFGEPSPQGGQIVAAGNYELLQAVIELLEPYAE